MRGESLERTTAGRMRAALLRMVVATAGLFAAWFSTAAVAVDASPVFRFYNTRTGTHFYTISAAERDSVLANYPWFAFEGSVYYGFTSQQPGTTPVYRFYNTKTGTHFYTQSESERSYVVETYSVFAY